MSEEPADESRVNYTSNYHSNAMNSYTITNNTNGSNINSSSNINTLSAVRKQRTYLSLKGRLEEMNMSLRHVKSVFGEVVLFICTHTGLFIRACCVYI